MGRYGKAAIEAVNLLSSRTISEPELAWDIATSKEFGKGTDSQKKGCPKGAFLGLCEFGMIKNIPIGSYTGSTENKLYAVRAVRALRKNPELTYNEELLWEQVSSGKSISHNEQLDVVLSLWNENLIKK